MSQDQPDIEALIKARLTQWFADDYSWDGLAKKHWKDDLTLQDYWRAGRSDADLRAAGELIEVDGQKTYHIMHLPLDYEEGAGTLKRHRPDECGVRMHQLLIEKIEKAAQESIKSNCAFEDRAIFAGAVFLKLHLSSSDVNVAFHADFTFGVFLEDVSFYAINFDEWSDFSNIISLGNFSVNKSVFHKSAYFNESVFLKENYFYETVFIDSVNYENSIFKNFTNFRGAVFEKSAHFTAIQWPSSPFDRHRMFDGATFHHLADFTGSGFQAFGAFDGARFEQGVRLDRVSEDEATRQFERELDQILNGQSPASSAPATRKAWPFRWKETLEDPTQHREREALLEQFESGCRVLKLEMEKMADKTREQLLFRFELKTRRKQDAAPWTEKAFSCAYDWFSDYGNSTKRPIVTLGGMMLAFGMLAYVADAILGPPVTYDHLSLTGDMPLWLVRVFRDVAWINLDDVFSAMSFSLSNTVHPITVLNGDNVPGQSVAHRLLTRYGEGVAFFTRLMSAAQSILSLLLVFLLALAIRRRFQIS